MSLEPRFVDYHCHLDLYKDHVAQFQKCTLQKIATFAVTTTPKAWPANVAFAEQSPFVRVGLGFHPQLVAERFSEFHLFEKYISESSYIGEVGLDASPQYYASYGKQKDLFSQVLRLCADLGNKILSVHSVRATRDVLNMIEELLPDHRSRVVLHWFGGSAKEARRAVELGCYFSINSEMLTKDSRRSLIATIPLDRILTETDGPFTSTASRPSQPADVSRVIGSMASFFGKAEEELRCQVLDNLVTLEARAWSVDVN